MFLVLYHLCLHLTQTLCLSPFWKTQCNIFITSRSPNIVDWNRSFWNISPKETWQSISAATQDFLFVSFCVQALYHFYSWQGFCSATEGLFNDVVSVNEDIKSGERLNIAKRSMAGLFLIIKLLIQVRMAMYRITIWHKNKLPDWDIFYHRHSIHYH